MEKVFVEIGTGQTPVVSMGDRIFGKGELYLGIDNSFYDISRAKKETENKKATFAQGEGASLPLPSNSVNEIFFGDVFSYVDSHIRENQASEAMGDLLDEAKRVLKYKNGLLRILETNTPTDRTRLCSLIENHGFHIVEEITAEDDQWVSKVSPYAARNGIAIRENMYKDPNKYMLLAKVE